MPDRIQLHAANIDGKLKQLPIKTAPGMACGPGASNGNVNSSVVKINAKSFSGALHGFGNTGDADEF